MRLAQPKGKDGTVSLRVQIVQLQVAVNGPLTTTTSKPKQSGGVRNGNGNEHNTRGQNNNQNNCEECNCKGIKCFQCKGWGH